MADNVTLDPGSGGAVVAADDVGSVFYQKVKLDIGADGATSGTAGTSSVPLRVDPTGTTAQPVTDNGGSLTVDGTVAVTGVATSAKQDTAQTTLAAIQTALELIDDVVRYEDGAHSSGHGGIPTFSVRQDTPSALGGTDGDYQPLITNNAGRVYASSTIDAALPAGTNNIGDVDVLTVPADPFGANADAAATAGSTGSIQAKLRLLTSQMDAIKTSVETIDNAIAGSEMQVDVLTMPVVAVTQSGTWDEVGINDSGNSITVDQATGTNLHTVVDSGTITTVSAVTAISNALPAGTNAIGKLAANSGVDIGDVDVTSVPTDPFGANADAASATGSISAKLRFIAATGIPVTGTVTVGSHAVTNAGTFAVQAASAGDVAHDGGDSGNPVKIGGKATNVEPAAVSATGDRANLITDMVGKLITLPYANPENFVSGAITSAMTGTTSTSLLAAPAAGLRNYITQITVSNSHATVGTDVIIQDGSGGTTLYTIPAAAVYGGATLHFPVPLRQPTTATAIFCANVTTGASTKVSASGYKGA